MVSQAQQAEPFVQDIIDKLANQEILQAIPEYRFEKPLHVFSKTGLDFAGPFSIKLGRAKQRLKSYILVFTCLQTRAVHLEATLDQSTASVMNAFLNFVDMRGLPDEFLSNNWKSFISPTKELEKMSSKS